MVIYEAGQGDGCQRGGSKSVCINTFRNKTQTPDTIQISIYFELKFLVPGGTRATTT